MFANTCVLQTAFDKKETPTSCLCPKSTSRFFATNKKFTGKKHLLL